MRSRILALVFLAANIAGLASADELTQMIQQDLVALGYEPGNTDGTATVETIVAISKFQAEHDLEVTGEATPQLAGIIKASLNQQARPAAAAQQPAATAAPVNDPATLRAAQQACLQQKALEAQQSQEKKRGFGRLARAITRTASRLGNDEFSSDVAQLSADIYDVNAIASDFQAAAEDLGLTASDIEDCRNPA